MKKPLRITYVYALTLVLTIFGCNNDDESPVANEINIEDLTITIDENPTIGQSVGTIQTNGGVSSFSITAQTPTGALSINASTGEVTVADATMFDFETNPVLTATISAVGAANTSAVTINLTDVNELSAQDLTVAMDENPTSGQSVGMIQADGDGSVSFSISSQTPAGALDIDAGTGELTVADAALFDYETNPTITATISIDNSGNMETATATIDLNDMEELSAQNLAVNIDENPTDGQVVGLIQVAAEVGTLSFSIVSQTPVGALAINTSTGELTVVDPNLFDFEANPIITATISVDDPINTATAVATINLTDVEEITVQDLTADVDENPANGQIIGAIQASSAGGLAYVITYQSTAGALSIDQNTGELSVADETLFDFETNPSIFAVISVDNGVYSVNANVTIDLNNLNEIGDFKYGGVIFWLDPSSNSSSGLVCAVSDQSNWIGASWGSNTPTIGNVATEIGAGQANTNAILAVHTQGTNAAKLCNSYSSNGFSDWYLPSKDELNEMYVNKSIIETTSAANGGVNFKNYGYWSSSEHATDPTRALLQFFNVGSQIDNQKAAIMHVRAIRSFTDF